MLPSLAHVPVGILLFTVVAHLATFPAHAAESGSAGELPRSLDGHELNLDFEKGTLDDWVAAGDAFVRQPVKGDTVTARGRGMKSEHAGQFWVGGYEVLLDDRPRGTLTSAPFKITQPFASFRIAGGSQHETRVEIVKHDTNRVIVERSGDNTETLKPVVVDLRPHVGREVFIRLVDASNGGWGHLNFDDFKLHATRPVFPADPNQTSPDEYPFAGLSPADAAKEMVVPAGFQVTLVAGEPDVMQPIAQAIDDRGRIWIAEAYTYPIRVPEGKGTDRILIFEDADGDGKFETRKVFLEGLNLVSGLEVGFGGVWIGAAPNLLFVADRDGDDRPDGPAASSARRLGLSRHARNAQHVHLGSRRLALWLPRRVHAFERRQTRRARTPSARVSTPACGAIIPRGTYSSCSPKGRATRGASISTTSASAFPRPV